MIRVAESRSHRGCCRRPSRGFVAVAAIAAAGACHAASIKDDVGPILSVGPEGEGNVEAAAAWKKASTAGPEALVDLLEAADGANALAFNWLQSAVDVVASRAVVEGGELPVDALIGYLQDTSHDPRARRLAFDIISSAMPDRAKELVPKFLGDPAAELRREAVRELLDRAGTAEGEARKELYANALEAARDVDQVEIAAEELEELGVTVDLPRHFGFLMRWKTIGPFDNTGRTGFDTVYPPENGIDLAAEYDGKEGRVTWEDFATADRFGLVDLNKAYTPLKEVVGYAYTEFESAEEREVELRLGCKNAWKVWLNGELLFGRDEYHRGMRIDQYRLPARLKKGKNTILVKACQNEEQQDWTVQWEFQLRVCDATGTAVLAENRGPTPTAEEATGSASTRRRRPNP